MGWWFFAASTLVLTSLIAPVGAADPACRGDNVQICEDSGEGWSETCLVLAPSTYLACMTELDAGDPGNPRTCIAFVSQTLACFTFYDDGRIEYCAPECSSVGPIEPPTGLVGLCDANDPAEASICVGLVQGNEDGDCIVIGSDSGMSVQQYESVCVLVLDDNWGACMLRGVTIPCGACMLIGVTITCISLDQGLICIFWADRSDSDLWIEVCRTGAVHGETCIRSTLGEPCIST